MSDEVEWETATEWLVSYDFGKTTKSQHCTSEWGRDFAVRWAQRNKRKNMRVVERVVRRAINPEREVSQRDVTDEVLASLATPEACDATR